MSKNKKIVLSALLLALALILSRFLPGIRIPILKVSLDFIPIMLTAIWLGPKYSILVAGLNDLIGAILVPFGAYFPGYTLSAVIMGAIYGSLIYKRPDKQISDGKFFVLLVISSVLVFGLVDLLLTTYWLNITIGKAYIPTLMARLPVKITVLPIQIIVIFSLEKILRPFVKKYLYD